MARLVVPEPGEQTLRVRLMKTSSDPAWTRIALLEGTTPIAVKYVSPPTSFDYATLTLSEADAENIVNYANLRVEVMAGVAVETGCSTCSTAPSAWVVTLSGISNGTCTDCVTLNDTHVLTYVSGCLWSKDLGARCGSMLHWYLQLERKGTSPNYFWQLTLLRDTTALIIWAATASFKCLELNRFISSGIAGACNYPAGIVVSVIPQ